MVDSFFDLYLTVFDHVGRLQYLALFVRSYVLDGCILRQIFDNGKGIDPLPFETSIMSSHCSNSVISSSLYPRLFENAFQSPEV